MEKHIANILRYNIDLRNIKILKDQLLQLKEEANANESDALARNDLIMAKRYREQKEMYDNEISLNDQRQEDVRDQIYNEANNAQQIVSNMTIKDLDDQEIKAIRQLYKEMSNTQNVEVGPDIFEEIDLSKILALPFLNAPNDLSDEEELSLYNS